MSLLRRTTLLALAGALLAAAPAAATVTPIQTTDAPTPVSADGQTAVFSVRESSSALYFLAVSENGGPARGLGLPPRPVPFDADIGPDGAPRVLLRDLKWPRSRASKELPGVPARVCTPSAVRGKQTCRTTRARRITALDLSNRHVALAVAYDAGADAPDTEIRIATRDGRRAQRLAHVSPGISGQQLIGPSLDGDFVFWARTCGGDPSGCPDTTSGAFRYRIGTGRYGLAGFTRRLTGFAATGARRAYEVRAPEMPGGYCGNSLPAPRATCQVVLDDALPSFRPLAEPPR